MSFSVDVYLDGVQRTGYANWQDLTKEIVRNDDLKIFTVQQVGELIFTGDARKYILDQQKALGVCGKIDILIVLRKDSGSGYRAVEGEIDLFTIVQSLKESSADPSIKCQLKDDGFALKILDGQNLSFFIGQGIDRNGNSYTGAASFELQTFDPFDNANLAGKVKAYDLKDAIEDLVNALSGGTITFLSTWYDALPDDERYAVTTGLNMRQQGQQDPYITLADIIENISKKYNLWLFATNTTGSNILRLEEESFITQTDEVVLNNVQGIEATTNLQKFYANITVGSSEADRDLTGVETVGAFDFMSEFPYIPGLNHTEEQWDVAGECTGGTSLELLTNWVIDHNKIKAAIIDNDDDNDDKVFLIQYDQSTLKASSERLTEPLTGGAYIYNPELVNIRVIDRFRLQGNVTNNFIQNTDKFNVGTTNTDGPYIDDAEWNPVELDVDSPLPFFNDNSRWDTVNFEFEVQETGVYRFTGEAFVEITNNLNSDNAIIGAWIFEYTPQGEFVQQYLLGVTSGIFAPGTIASVDYVEQPAYLKKGNFARHVLRVDWGTSPAVGVTFTFLDSNPIGGDPTFIELVKTVTAGEADTDQNPSNYFALNYIFDHPLDQEAWQEMEQDPARQVSVFNAFDGGTKRIVRAWPQRITHSLVTGETKWQLVSNFTETPFS